MVCILPTKTTSPHTSTPSSSPVIGLRESGGGGRPRLLLPPHEILQLTELGPEVGVGGGDGLGDGGVDVGYSWLRGSTEVSISFTLMLRI